ncbi:unnamed protein product [Candidula unifasciata]|uniref:RPA-interacting protein C-terminal domain-containing protein n=1 Tax=Candidula unifasciata TaxID=100452 RepID=A0A8S3YGB9_9EUPU|nr:unnamed protein product [Candidula unifasciata]
MSKDKTTRQETRQDMYKNNSRSPCWKQQFRMRCLERLKDSRGRHMSSKRLIDGWQGNTSTAQDLKAQEKSDYVQNQHDVSDVPAVPEIEMIMREEFDRLKSEVSSAGKRGQTRQDDFRRRAGVCEDASMATDNTLFNAREDNTTQFNEHENECLNDLISWYEEVYNTLRLELREAEQREEELRVNQLKAREHLKHEEEELCSGMRAMYCEEVCCPLCEKDSLIEQKSLILCSCGLNINIEQDSITLKHVKDNLAAGTEEHSQKCESKPAFSLNQKFGISNLLMSCQDCDFLFVIV